MQLAERLHQGEPRSPARMPSECVFVLTFMSAKAHVDPSCNIRPLGDAAVAESLQVPQAAPQGLAVLALTPGSGGARLAPAGLQRTPPGGAAASSRIFDFAEDVAAMMQASSVPRNCT